MSTRPKKAARRRPAAPAKSSPRRRKPPAPKARASDATVDLETAAPPPPSPPAVVTEHEPEVPLATPEPAFAGRVSPPAPDRPHPDRRRAIFFDVENTSRAEHIARVIDHLAVDRLASRTEFIAVGNWRVIGHDTARLLARHGAQLVHSAPSVGVRDWSDLRIAVGAGVWLAAARAGDVIELVSDDRAFDAVGDVAASLGITFRRLSFRRLAGMRADGAAAEAPAPEPARAEQPRAAAGGGRRRGRRGGRGRDGRDHREHRDRERPRPAPVPAAPPAAHTSPTGASVLSEKNGEPAIEPHTAPHDEIVNVVRELIDRSRDGAISMDTLANALKSRGFRRPPGSPRLITRLRRIREIAIDRTGRITLVGGPAPAHHPAAVVPPDEVPPVVEDHAPVEPDGNRLPPPAAPGEEIEPDDEPTPGNELEGGPGRVPPGDVQPGARRRRSRRGGRGRRRGRSGAPAAP